MHSVPCCLNFITKLPSTKVKAEVNLNLCRCQIVCQKSMLHDRAFLNLSLSPKILSSRQPNGIAALKVTIVMSFGNFSSSYVYFLWIQKSLKSSSSFYPFFHLSIIHLVIADFYKK